ncbi:MAG: lysylphosphatidylglycerol synthase transmembrane domain-containing protein [Dehalococcoidia bacterium]|nr:lysylphosphatidylglycerol synthase transmembrane domain-containing protein [Dehalococcoidia bacterium]
MKFGRPSPWTLVRIIGAAAVGATFLWWVWRDVDNQALVDRLGDFPPVSLLIVIELLLVSGTVRAYRWSLLFPSDRPPVRRLFLVENTGIGFNSVSPIRVVAEPVQFGYLALRYRYDGGTVLASLVLVRVVDLVITLSMIAVGFLVFRPQADIPGYVWGGIGIFASIAVIVIGISLQSGRIRFTDRLKFLGAYSDVWRDLARKPGQLGAVAGTTAALWGVKGAAAYIIVLGLDIDLSLPETHVLMLAVTTLGLTLPGLPSGLGPIEFAATFFLPFYGVGETNSLAFGLVLHGTFLLPPIAIAVATLLIVGGPWPSPREADA